MIKDSLFGVEITAEDVIRDLEKELKFIRQSIEVSESLEAEMEAEKKNSEYDSIDYKGASRMHMIYKGRSSVYWEIENRLADLLKTYKKE